MLKVGEGGNARLVFCVALWIRVTLKEPSSADIFQARKKSVLSQKKFSDLPSTEQNTIKGRSMNTERFCDVIAQWHTNPEIKIRT